MTVKKKSHNSTNIPYSFTVNTKDNKISMNLTMQHSIHEWEPRWTRKPYEATTKVKKINRERKPLQRWWKGGEFWGASSCGA